MAKSSPGVPAAGRWSFMVSSSTSSTEVDERLPTSRRLFQVSSSAPSGSSRTCSYQINFTLIYRIFFVKQILF